MSKAFNKVHLIRQVDLFTLKLFLSVVEEGQVGRAAARENIAASAATKRIQDLEEIVGMPLFERNPRGVIPTAAGLVLARHLTQVFGIFEDIRSDISEFTEGVRGLVRVASTGGIIFQYLSREIGEFARSFPQVDIDLREGANPEVVRTVLQGEVDVGVFAAAPGLTDELPNVLEYRTDRLVAVVPIGHPLARQSGVKIVELLAHNYIAIAPFTSLMAQVRHAAGSAGIPFKPKYSVNSVYAAASLVRVNQGVTIQPDHMLTPQDLKFVQTVPLDEPWAARRLFVATPAGRSVSVATRNFIAQLVERPV
ncbi:LysR family transcriptional regulator [Pseudorhodoferax sp.]|uniref:LysR family transcriptional regulator n=1 Tax=Pseudorhodoferax sp. TaxID=1993553 RepID=UPI0039E57BB3